MSYRHVPHGYGQCGHDPAPIARAIRSMGQINRFSMCTNFADRFAITPRAAQREMYRILAGHSISARTADRWTTFLEIPMVERSRA